MRTVGQFKGFTLDNFFNTPEFKSAVIRMVNYCFKNGLAGGVIINGLLFEADKIYNKVEWKDFDMLIFSNSLNRFLYPGTEYEVLTTGGFKLLIGMQPTVEDNYIAFVSNI